MRTPRRRLETAAHVPTVPTAKVCGSLDDDYIRRMAFVELVTLVVDDYDRAIRFFVDMLGVTFRSPPRTEPYGRVAVFVDVAGNAWDLLGPRGEGAP